MAFLLLGALGALGFGRSLSAGESYELSFSTYLGGTAWEHARDVFADAQGNVYICGGTASRDFPTTPGAYDTTFNSGDASGEECDAFVCKFGPDGRLIWSTFLGSPGYDRAYGIEVDAQSYVYVAGRAGRGFPTTPGTFQPTFRGYNSGGYGGFQNAFVAKLSPDGSKLIWASHVGVGQLCRDIAVDARGDIYLPLAFLNRETLPPIEWFANAFQKAPKGGTDCGAIKISSDGTKVLWATWLGGSSDESQAASIRVDNNGYVSLYFHTLSADMPVTSGVFDPSYNGKGDGFVARLMPDGSGLVFGTYLGGSTGDEWISTHNLAVDQTGNIYVSTQTGSSDFPVTRGAVQRIPGGGTDIAIAKFSPTGTRLAATYLGGSAGENADGLYVDSNGNVLITGDTQSSDFPMTADAHQGKSQGGGEAFLVVLSADFNHLLYGTCLGGPSNDNGRSGFLGSDGSLYVTGSSDGPGWPIKNEYQATFKGGAGDWGSGDVILAKFSPAPAITLDPRRTYQTITGWEAVAFALEPADPAFPNFRNTLFDQVVNDLGTNRVRLEVRSGVENTNDNWSDYQAGRIDYQTWRSRRYATGNDNADPWTLNASGFHFSEMDSTIDRIVNPLRALLAAKGEKLIVNVNYVAFTAQITNGIYIHNDPAEYAEFVLATYQHLKDKYGWVPDLWEALLEPDNVSQWNGKLLGQAIVAAAARLKEAGFEPAFVAPSNTNMGKAVTYFDQMIAVPGVLPVLREFSYHRYGGVSLVNLQAIAARAKQHGINTAMLEWWSTGNGYSTLHEDLKIGNNSAWEQGVLGGALNSAMSLYQVDTSNPAQPRVLIGNATKFLRQYYKFVRPGAVRIEATSQETAFDPLAFINTDGDYAVVVKCSSGGSFSIGGLPAGTYGVKYTTAGSYDVDLPDQDLYAGQAAAAAIPQPGVLTVYSKPTLSDKEPPSVPTQLAPKQNTPTEITLTWNSAIDDSGVSGYKIYRDGARIGFSPTPTFDDMNVQPGASYTYEVTAYDGAGNESPRSTPLVVAVAEPPAGTDLLGYWRFEDGRVTAATDSSAHGRLLPVKEIRDLCGSSTLPQ